MVKEDEKCECPICGWRVFDIKPGTYGRIILAIKCPRCRQISGIVIADGKQVKNSVPSKQSV